MSHFLTDDMDEVKESSELWLVVIRMGSQAESVNMGLQLKHLSMQVGIELGLMRKTCIIIQTALLAWFFLDMTGLTIAGGILVTRSWREDGIFFLVDLLAFALFLFKEKIGKWVVAIWLSVWLVFEFISHEWYTIFGWGIGTVSSKIRFFSGEIQWLHIPGRYVPDLYHTILHLLILATLISVVIYIVRSRKQLTPQTVSDDQ